MVNKYLKAIPISLMALAVLCCSLLAAIEEQVERHKLDNGATLLLLPIEGVPIVSCITINDVGGVREEPGITGISHYLEHMAFKGTETIGTKDIAAEKEALDRCHAIFDQILEERKKGDEADQEKLEELQVKLDEAVEYANQYIIENEFNEILQRNGGRGLNAGTGQDMTMYSVSLPSNKVELWMLMEAERFTKPVWREFYQERDVILEERRMIYSNPVRAFMNDFAHYKLRENPYRYSVIGFEEDIENFRVKDIENYFEKYYGAKNLVFAIVGDIDTETTLELAKKYLAEIPPGKKSGRVEFDEPEQTEERFFTQKSPAQPILIVGYHSPAATHSDYPTVRAIADILGQGRSSRLHQSLVEEKQLAVSAFAFPGFPGSAYENLFIVVVIPAPGIDLDDCLAEVDRQIDMMRTVTVRTEELEGVKKRALKSSYDRLRSRFGLAMQLAYYESLFGDYRLMFEELEETESITKEDIQRVMQTLFVPEKRTVGNLQTRSN